MRNAITRLQKRMTWAMVLVSAAVMAVTASASALGEQASARPPAARKLSYHDFRRGLFALSKVETAPIVMLGDSLTEAAPWRELTGCLHLVNRGIGGDTTKGVLARLDDIVKLKPRAVFLMIGVNDISLNISKDASVANLRAILTRLDRADIRSLAAYVLPVAASYRKKQINAGITALNVAFAGVFAEHPSTQAIDLRTQVRGVDGYLREDLSYDGLHLDAKGYALWRDAIAPHVARYCVM